MDKPCISACPAGALERLQFDVGRCRSYLRTEAGRGGCLEHGCLARDACPVGQDYRYPPEQLRFHMSALEVFVGYAYQQLTGDSGEGATLGDFKSRVFGVGPQLGCKFDAGDETAGYVNLKGYYEFGAKNRPEGWNVWLTLAFSPAPKPPMK